MVVNVVITWYERASPVDLWVRYERQFDSIDEAERWWEQYRVGKTDATLWFSGYDVDVQPFVGCSWQGKPW